MFLIDLNCFYYYVIRVKLLSVWRRVKSKKKRLHIIYSIYLYTYLFAE